MSPEKMEKDIRCVTQEGLNGLTLREYREKRLAGLEEPQAEYFSKIRNDMNRLAISRVMTAGQSTDTVFCDIEKPGTDSSPDNKNNGRNT